MLVVADDDVADEGVADDGVADDGVAEDGVAEDGVAGNVVGTVVPGVGALVVGPAGTVGTVVVTGVDPGDSWPLKGPVTAPGEVRLPAVTAASGTVIGLPGVPRTPGTVLMARGRVPGRTRDGGPSLGSQASAGSVHDPAAAHASAANVRSWTSVLAPPVEWMASMATKQPTLRQLALPNAVVSTAGRARETFRRHAPLEPDSNDRVVPAVARIFYGGARFQEQGWGLRVAIDDGIGRPVGTAGDADGDLLSIDQAAVRCHGQPGKAEGFQRGGCRRAGRDEGQGRAKEPPP